MKAVFVLLTFMLGAAMASPVSDGLSTNLDKRV